jgi:predicted ATPase
VLAALPGARILELGVDGAVPRAWDELDLVRDWRDFLAAPERWFRHLSG